MDDLGEGEAADDDASGCAVMLELARVLKTSVGRPCLPDDAMLAV